MSLFYQATWDTRDDWIGSLDVGPWISSGMGIDITASRASTGPALPWIGGAGRHQTTWTAGVGTVSYYMAPPGTTAQKASRTYRSTFALYLAQMDLSGARVGPMRVAARDNTAGALGEMIALSITPSGDALTLKLANLFNLAVSANSIDLRRFVREWLVFDLSVASTGASAPYTTTAWCDVWVHRCGRLRFLTRLALADYSGSAFDFSDIRFGFGLLAKNVDNLDLYLDEFRFDNSGGAVALPRAPSLAVDGYQVYARIRKYDKPTGTWKSVAEIDRRAIVSLTCSFLAYRIEDRCELKLLDPGRYTDTEVQDVLADMEKNPQSLYRLDVYAPDVTYNNPQYPSNWPNDFIYWSGILTRREQDRAQQSRGITIAATGWTAFLRNVALTKKIFFKQTISAILTSILTTLQSAWPGAITLSTRTGGLDARLIVQNARFDQTNVFDAVTSLANLGQFTFGVAVSGWPGYELKTSNEFRLIFFEPHAELDVTAPTIGTGDECGIFLDAANDKHSSALTILTDDSKYANRFMVLGAPLHIDFISVVSGNTRAVVRDKFAYSDVLKESGIFQFEPGFVGFDFVLLDRARRQINFVDSASGDVFLAGRLEDLPSNLQVLDGQSIFPVIDLLETSGTIDWTLGNFPASVENLTLDLTSDVIRYTLQPNNVVVLRTIDDNEDATARGAIVATIIDSLVKGYQGAGTLALQAMYAERRNAESVRLTIKAWKRTPNGSRNQTDNLVALSFGQDRMTLCGTTGNLGDGWKYGDDERTAGYSRFLEIRAVTMTLEEGGWSAEFQLGAAPRDLQAVLTQDPGPSSQMAGPRTLYKPVFMRGGAFGAGKWVS